MGENAARFQPDIDLDEFERRLRAAAPSSRPAQAEKSDPLAELARIVGGEGMAGREDPFEALFRAQAAIAELRKDHGAAQEPLHAPHEPYFNEAPSVRPQAASGAGRVAHEFRNEAPRFSDAPSYAEAEPQWTPEPSVDAADAAVWDGAYQEMPAPPAPAGRRKAVVYGMAAVLLAGVAAIGGTLALRGRSGPHDIVTIQADTDPARIKPQQAETASNSGAQGLFDRKVDGNVAKVVSNEEQPADLNATVKAARVASPAAAVATPVPPAPAVAAAVATAPEGDPIFPPPRKVKTIAVRADGSLIDAPEAKPQAASGLPSMASGFPALNPPAAAAPAKPTNSRSPAAKSTDRAVTAADASQKERAKRQHAVKVAAAKPAAVKPAEPAEAAPEIAGATGIYAVQLAGSPVASEARSAANRLSAKYSGALHGRHATFVVAKVGAKTVYRVRVGHLTEETATSMCSAIKGAGGHCFVARD